MDVPPTDTTDPPFLPPGAAADAAAGDGRRGPLRAALDVREWRWSETLLRAGAAALALPWAVAHGVGPGGAPQAWTLAWGAFAFVVASRWVAGLPDGAARMRRARAAGRAWPVRLCLLLVPAELSGLLRLLALTVGGAVATLARRAPPPRPEGWRLEDRRRGFHDAMFAMNLIGFVPEVPLMLLILPPAHAEPWLHVLLHGGELALLALILGDHWWVRAGGHVLTATHLDLRAGARAAARVPLSAIERVERLERRTSLGAWRRAQGLRRAETGVVSVLDHPNIALTLRRGTGLSWSRLQVTRPLPRCLFVYVDDPAAMAASVTAAVERLAVGADRRSDAGSLAA